MYPELFEIPFIHVTIKSHGFMMVVGFLVAVPVIRYLIRNIRLNSQVITNLALYSLIAGVAGARTFFVIHHLGQFEGRLASIFAVWEGGLEFYGGVIFAIPVIVLCLLHHKLPIRRYLDILAIGLMLGLAFGRIGCFLNGCCFGKPTQLPWAVRFPYGSFAYHSQVYRDYARDRSEPYRKLPDEFFDYHADVTVPGKTLKPYERLSEEQKEMLKANNQLRSLPVHPTQLYSSANAALLCFILYIIWRRSEKSSNSDSTKKLLTEPGLAFSLAFILYGIARFFIEFLRDDNPFEVDSLTISQLLSIASIALGAVLIAILHRIKPKPLSY
ncbi:MAG: prolipoprotein diacylglyceryl transferase [Planctomycetes bacterium]|nr:prolipoprotein diacylglyceryl transferase [Planctomycetota bacterium]